MADPAQKIRELLKAKGMTQAEFARRLGVSPQQASYLLRSLRGWKKERWDKAADVLGVSPAELYPESLKTTANAVVLSVVFDRGEYKRLGEAAKGELRDPPNLVRYIVLQWLKNYEQPE